jgi:hypothetical protein
MPETAILPSPDVANFCCMRATAHEPCDICLGLAAWAAASFSAHARGKLPSDSRCEMHRCTRPAAIIRGRRCRPRGCFPVFRKPSSAPHRSRRRFCSSSISTIRWWRRESAYSPAPISPGQANLRPMNLFPAILQPGGNL